MFTGTCKSIQAECLISETHIYHEICLTYTQLIWMSLRLIPKMGFRLMPEEIMVWLLITWWPWLIMILTNFFWHVYRRFPGLSRLWVMSFFILKPMSTARYITLTGWRNCSIQSAYLPLSSSNISTDTSEPRLGTISKNMIPDITSLSSWLTCFGMLSCSQTLPSVSQVIVSSLSLATFF